MKKQGVLIYDDVIGRMDLHHNSAFTQNLGLTPVPHLQGRHTPQRPVDKSEFARLSWGKELF